MAVGRRYWSEQGRLRLPRRVALGTGGVGLACVCLVATRNRWEQRFVLFPCSRVSQSSIRWESSACEFVSRLIVRILCGCSVGLLQKLSLLSPGHLPRRRYCARFVQKSRSCPDASNEYRYLKYWCGRRHVSTSRTYSSLVCFVTGSITSQ